MKFLQINTVANSGSTGRIAEGIGMHVQKQEWESHIAYGRYANSSESPLYKIGTKTDIYLHVMQTRLFDKHGFASSGATKKLIKYIEELKPDIIHLHNIHGYYLNIELLFRYLSQSKIPVVWTLHDCWAFTGHCSHFDYVGCSKWETECYECPEKRMYPASLIFDNSKNNYTRKKKAFTSVENLTIVTPSRWLEGKVKNSFLNNYPVKVINNGIDLDVFKPIKIRQLEESLDLKGKFVILGVASVWSRRKGMSDFIELSKKLDSGYRVILVGLSKKQIRDLPKNIIGIERTENIYRLVELYSMAGVVLNISYEETFGMTTVEGFACGTPSIVYNATASPELINDKTGFIINKGDIDGLVCAIGQIKSRGKEFYSLNCRQRAERLYNKDDRFNNYIELYKSILDKK